jgi:ADP-ribosylglycohydrolase
MSPIRTATWSNSRARSDLGDSMASARQLDRGRDALLGTFAADALGMPFEGVPPEAVPERCEMVNARLGCGTYTDDTQMAIALAESLLDCGDLDAEHLGRAFLQAYDPRRGYGSGTRAVLAMIADGVSVAEAATRAFDGCGSLATERRCASRPWRCATGMTAKRCLTPRGAAHA